MPCFTKWIYHFGEQYKITSRKANCTQTTTTLAKSNGHIHIRRNLVHPNHRTCSRTRTIGTFSGTPGKSNSVQTCTKITLVCTIIISGHCTPSAANVAQSPTMPSKRWNQCHVLPGSTDIGAGQILRVHKQQQQNSVNRERGSKRDTRRKTASNNC
jgi:hypothetical protein